MFSKAWLLLCGLATTAAISCQCPLLKRSECTGCPNDCAWSNDACQTVNGSMPTHFKWNGFMELGQTHVVKAVGESRHAPNPIAERECELLFTPTQEAQPTPAPTPSPTATIEHNWGLEQLGHVEVELANPNSMWAAGYPKSESDLLIENTEYYLSPSNPDININFDLDAERIIQGVFLKTWYTSKIASIEVGVHPDDGFEGEQPAVGSITIPDTSKDTWQWFILGPVTGGYNNVRQIIIPKISARYVQFRLRGGNRDGNSWGLRQIQISGSLDGLGTGNSGEGVEDSAVEGQAYFPPFDALIRLVAYSPNGKLLGALDMRNPDEQRPLLEQALTTTQLQPYSTEAWSATLPWNWMKEGTTILVGTEDPTNGLLLHRLELRGLSHWGLHVLTRSKLIIFGTPEEAAALDTFSHAPEKLASGMFNSLPTSELRWVDTTDLHLPYLVVRTSQGPVLVHSEAERRNALIAAGDDPTTEPRWEVLKQHFAFRHRLAHTGRGVAETQLTCCSSSPYSSGTSIFMGWAKSENITNVWTYDKLGYWDGFSAAAWTGWTGMRPGDECGNTLIHELGHSQTMSHFTTGSSTNWGIDVEYPNDGTNEEWHPWGYDTTTRRFRTWYRHSDITVGKRDPMNGGERGNSETCFPQYTGYHAAKSQKWGSSKPVILSAGLGKNVDADGSYLFNEGTKQYERLTAATIEAKVENGASLPLKVGVPVMTLFGTIGGPDEVCQIYPEMKSNHGNTFDLPSPETTGLGSKYDGAAYMVEISFATGPKESVLIASTKLTASSQELRFFALTIALSKQPTSIELFSYDNDAYPLLTATSAKTSLFVRSLDSSTDNLPAVVKAGRSWVGMSNEVTLNEICSSAQDCSASAEEISWSSMDLGALTYTSSGAISSRRVSNANVIEVTVERQEDGTEHTVNVVAQRFSGSTSSSLLNASASNGEDLTHGVRFWIPYDLNPSLPNGKYASSHSNKLSITAKLPGGGIFEELHVNLSFMIHATTDVDLSNGKVFTSQAFSKTATSAYFLAEDPAVGPTTSVWWGGSLEKLRVPLVSDCLRDQVTAVVRGQQKTTCSSTKWQMNAGRSANDCGHQLILTLESLNATSGVNTWMSGNPGCLFYSHPAEPIIINAHRWHSPNGGAKLGTLALNFNVQLPGTRVYVPSASPSSPPIDGPAPTSTPTVTPTDSPSVPPTKQPTRTPTKEPTRDPTSVPTDIPTATPTVSPTATPTNSPSKPPTLPPTANPTESPSKSPTASPTATPTLPPTGNPTKSPTASPSALPTASPTIFVHEWGIEQFAAYDVALAGTQTSWANTFPRDKSRLIEPESEYYLSVSNPDANVNFDFFKNEDITGVFLKSWYVTEITQIVVGVHPDDGASFSTSVVQAPAASSPEWKWYDLEPISGCCNKERIINIPHVQARYVQVQLRGASSSYSDRWGLRQIQISGSVNHTPSAVPSSSAPTKSPTRLPTKSPTSSPTVFVHKWGLEQVAGFDVALAGTATTWASTFPRDKSRLLVPDTEYYLSNSNPDANINFDFKKNADITGAYLKSWYVTKIPTIQVGVHPDDGAPTGGTSVSVPSISSAGWTWYTVAAVPGCCNHEREIKIPHVKARYVQFQMRGGYSSYGGRWGLRQVKISGSDS